MLLDIQLVQALFQHTLSLIECRDYLFIISLMVVTGCFEGFAGKVQLVHSFNLDLLFHIDYVQILCALRIIKRHGGVELKFIVCLMWVCCFL